MKQARFGHRKGAISDFIGRRVGVAAEGDGDIFIFVDAILDGVRVLLAMQQNFPGRHLAPFAFRDVGMRRDALLNFTRNLVHTSHG